MGLQSWMLHDTEQEITTQAAVMVILEKVVNKLLLRSNLKAKI